MSEDLSLIHILTAALGFYCHDRTVIQSAADELAMFGSLWSGRYLSLIHISVVEFGVGVKIQRMTTPKYCRWKSWNIRSGTEVCLRKTRNCEVR